MVTKGDRLGVGKDGLGIWDGNAVKLGCDDGCTIISIIKFIELKKNEHRALNAQRTKAGDTSMEGGEGSGGSRNWPNGSVRDTEMDVF